MTDISVRPCAHTEIAHLKNIYRTVQTVPLDGMWQAFVDMGTAYGIYRGETLAGYGVLNAEQKLLQFWFDDDARAVLAFDILCETAEATGAFVATSEAPFVSLALDSNTSVRAHALLYQLADDPHSSALTDSLISAGPARTQDVVTFVHATLAADKGWLEGYYGTLASRGEIFVIEDNSQIIAVGEYRRSDNQKGIVDLGMIVGQAARGRGLATHILCTLAAKACAEGLRPICSTEVSNIAAQTAIARAGFTAPHRILDISFE